MNHVLLISQDSAFQHVVEKFLNWKGVPVKMYSKATDIENWETIENSIAVISEYNTPGLDGFSFLSALRERHADTKLIMVANDLSVSKECPLYYEVLDGFFTKRSFSKMMPRLLAPIPQMAI